jgi:hypothetical protein
MCINYMCWFLLAEYFELSFLRKTFCHPYQEVMVPFVLGLNFNFINNRQYLSLLIQGKDQLDWQYKFISVLCIFYMVCCILSAYKMSIAKQNFLNGNEDCEVEENILAFVRILRTSVIITCTSSTQI